MDDVIETAEFPSVAARSVALGFDPPTSIALLPRNFVSATSAQELLDESSAATIHQLFRQAGVPEDRFDTAEAPFPSVAEHSVDWIAPIIFIGAAYASENSSMVNVALGVVANYVYELFGSLPGRRRVRLDVVVERDGSRTSKRVSYEGSAEGVQQLIPAVERALSDDD